MRFFDGGEVAGAMTWRGDIGEVAISGHEVVGEKNSGLEFFGEEADAGISGPKDFGETADAGISGHVVIGEKASGLEFFVEEAEAEISGLEVAGEEG